MRQHKGRVDIRVEDNRFNFSHVRAGGTALDLHLSKANWLMSADQEKHWFVEGRLGEDWSQIYLEFISGGTGTIRLELRNGWFDDFEVNRHEVWVGDAELEGEGLSHIKFRGMDDGEDPGRQVMRTRTGKKAVLVWHCAPAVERIPVKAGKRYRLGAWFKANVV